MTIYSVNYGDSGQLPISYLVILKINNGDNGQLQRAYSIIISVNKGNMRQSQPRVYLENANLSVYKTKTNDLRLKN